MRKLPISLYSVPMEWRGGVLVRTGPLPPKHPFEEPHDEPTPGVRCWYCLEPRGAKVHQVRKARPA